MGCCVLGLVPIKNIVSTMWHGQRTGLRSWQMLSNWQPMKWIRRLNRLRLGWTRRRLLRTFSSNGKKHGQTAYAVQGWQLSRWLLGEQHSYAKQAPLKLIGYSCQLSRTSLHFLRCNKVSLLGYSGRRVPPPGDVLGRRSCSSQYSSPMICF